MITIGGIQLSDDLMWTDEMAWAAYRHQVKPNLAGGVTISGGALKGNSGRKMTLSAPYAWVQRSTLLSLLQLFSSPGPYNIKLHDAREFYVVCSETMEAPQLLEDPEPSDTTWYNLTLHLVIVA